MPRRSKIEKRYFHKKQRKGQVMHELNILAKSSSLKEYELEMFEDEVLNITDEYSNNYSTMKSNGGTLDEEQYY